MHIRKLLALLILIASCSGARAEPEKAVVRHFDDAIIVSVTRPGVGSGILHTWAVLTASLPNQEVIELLITYFGEGQAFPPVKARCSIDAREEIIEGAFFGDANVDLKTPKLVPYLMECDGTIFRY